MTVTCIVPVAVGSGIIQAIAHLRSIPIFRALPATFLAELAHRMRSEKYSDGGVILQKGHAGRAFFVVAEGTVEVMDFADHDVASVVTRLRSKDCFGEMSILEPAPRSATVRAVAPTMLVKITNEHVDQLLYRRDLKNYSLFLMNIARELSRRLRVADGIVAQLVTAVSDEYVAKRRR